MANFQNTYRDFARIAVPYFRSDDKWPGRILLLTVIGLQLFQVWLNVRFNAWYNTFYTALQDKDWNTFIWQIGVFSVLAAFFIVSAVYQLYLQQWLQIRWRNWLTQRYLGRWLGQGTHYRMRLKGDQADNPDQRIADDIRQFIELDARYRHRPARLDRDAGVFRGDPVDPVVGHAADDRLADL